MTLEQMRAALDKVRNNGRSTKDGDSNIPYFKMTPGKYKVRVLNNEEHGPIHEWHWHYNVGDKGKQFACNKKNFGDDCPICDLASSLWDGYKATEDAGQADAGLRQAAINLFAKNRYYANVLERGKESEGPKVYSFGKRVCESLYETFIDPDYEGMVLDEMDGYDFNLTFSQDDPKDKRSCKTIVQASPKTSPVMPTRKETADMIEKAPVLSELYTASKEEDIIAALDSYNVPDDDDSVGEEKYAGSEPVDTGNSVLAAIADLEKD